MTGKRQPLFDNGLNAYVLPSLPPFALPPLPPVSDKQLLRIAFTHASIFQHIKKRDDLHPKEMPLDYEKLEHVGDSILGVIVTILLHDMYPFFREGVATVIKGMLVCNTTLAQISDRYDLRNRLIAAPNVIIETRMQTKTRASLFEAYIAALFYSLFGELGALDSAKAAAAMQATTGAVSNQETASEGKEETPASDTETSDEDDNGTEEDDGASVDTDDISSREDEAIDLAGQRSHEAPEDSDCRSEKSRHLIPTLPVEGALPEYHSSSTRESIADQAAEIPTPASTQPLPCPSHQANGPRRGEGFDQLEKWLRPLFTPIAEFAVDCLRKEQVRLSFLPADYFRRPEPSEWLEEDKAAEGWLGMLNSTWSQQNSSTPKYDYQKIGDGNDEMWRCRCVAKKEEQEWEGIATRFSKKAAQHVAAWKVCKQLGLT